MTMKVLEINVDDIGASGVYSLVKNVIVHAPEDIQIDIACWEPFEKQSNIDELKSYGTDVHYIGYPGNKLVKQVKCNQNLKKLIREKQYDCVHIHSDVANKMLVAAKAAKAAGVKKIILHSHASDVDGNHREMKRRIHKLCRKSLPSLGNVFVSCSDLAADWMFPKVSLDRIVMIKNGVDLDTFAYTPEVRSTMRKELGMEENFIVGHVGRFAYQKNHGFLLEVFRNVHEKDPSARLLLVGDGPDRASAEEKARELGIYDSVVFYGISKRVPELFQAMDVFALPSHFEGLPIVGVEAQAAGLPVLFSDCITKEAQLLDSVKYLPIGEENTSLWADAVLSMKDEKRENTTAYLKEQGFDIETTIQSFTNLYR